MANGYALSYEKPQQIDWNSKIPIILKLMKQGYSLVRIEKTLNLPNIKNTLWRYRKKPRWLGKIPYLKRTPAETIQNTTQRIGILDIEFFSQDFSANKGFIISYCIKEYHKDKIYTGLIDTNDIRKGLYDKNIVQKLIKDILKFDILVGYYSSGCDIPWIRTRAIKNKLEFPYHDTIKQFDLYYVVKFKLKLKRSSLKAACELCGIKGKTDGNFDAWWDFVMAGNKKAGDDILLHNIADVRITEKLFDKLKNYFKGQIKTI